MDLDLTSVADYYRAHLLYTPDNVTDGPTDRTEAAYRDAFGAIATDGRTAALAYGPSGWTPTNAQTDPYPTDTALRSAAALARSGRRYGRPGCPVLVSNLAHGGAWLGNDAANLVFRAHHDAVHVADGARAFCPHGEAFAALRQVERLGLSFYSDAACVLFWEVIGQTAYHVQTGRFPLVRDNRQPHAPVNDGTVTTAGHLLTCIRDATDRAPKQDRPYRVRSVNVWSDVTP